MTSTEDQWTVEQRVLDYLRNNGIAPGSTVLVALSGGPDSTCLLGVLGNLRHGLPVNLHAAYLDHGIRTILELKEELTFVQRTCSAMGIAHKTEMGGVLLDLGTAAGRGMAGTLPSIRSPFNTSLGIVVP